MSSVPFPYESPEQWDNPSLAGFVLPGICTVDVDLENELDVKKPKGKAGATVTRQGANPASVRITITMTTPEDFTEYQALLPLLRPNSPKQQGGSGPLAILHPRTTMYGVSAVIVKKITDKQGKSGDVYEVSLDCIEHLPPSKKVQTKTDTRKIPNFDNKIAGGANAPPGPTPPSSSGASNP